MGAGLGFKTFVTGDVLTAADTNGYLMQGVWVFASAAARDAAVTSPQEGNVCYLKSTDAVMTYSGSAWVAVGGSTSALTKITTGTFTTVANTSTTFDGVFTSTYKKYMIVSNNLVTSSNPLTVSLQLRAAAVTKATNYYGAIDRVGYSGTSTITGTNNGASCPLGEGNTTYAIGLTMYFTNVGNSSQKAVFYGSGTSGNDNAATSLGYYQDTADTYTGFILSVASGTISGTVTVYGLEN